MALDMDSIDAKANQLLAEIPAKAQHISGLIDRLLPGAMRDVHQGFLALVEAKTLDESRVATDVNPDITNASVEARAELAELVETLSYLEMWLTLSVPAVSDGNNFGVEVQELLIKMLKEKKDAAKALFDGLNTYSSSRADLWSKAVFPVVRKQSSSKGETKKTGGEKDSNETTESSNVEQTHNMVVTDAIAAIAGLDTQQYFHLKCVFSEMLKSYMVIGDQLNKNMAKLMDPRGERGGGGGGISMF
jgi:hypothetical protein